MCLSAIALSPLEGVRIVRALNPLPCDRSARSIRRKPLHQSPPTPAFFTLGPAICPRPLRNGRLSWRSFPISLLTTPRRKYVIDYLRHFSNAKIRCSRAMPCYCAGLSFFADDLNVDLALMQFVREARLVPIADRPFTFALNFTPSKAAERCLSSFSNQVGGE